jgi:hypothetical protein
VICDFLEKKKAKGISLYCVVCFVWGNLQSGTQICLWWYLRARPRCATPGRRVVEQRTEVRARAILVPPLRAAARAVVRAAVGRGQEAMASFWNT